jgi:hypothetical protein
MNNGPVRYSIEPNGTDRKISKAHKLRFLYLNSKYFYRKNHPSKFQFIRLMQRPKIQRKTSNEKNDAN